MSERAAPRPPNPVDRSKGFQIPPGGEWAKELQKFEQFAMPYAPEPGNPYQFREFPKMVYVGKDWMGKIASQASVAPQWEFKSLEEHRRAEAGAEDFSQSCQRIVKDEKELQEAYEAGYRDDPHEAVAHAQARADAISRGAAERHHSDQKMSGPAQREAAAADADTGEHLAAIPEKPLARKRGRPKGSKNKRG